MLSEQRLVFWREVNELHSDSETWRSADHRALQSNLRPVQPHEDIKKCTRSERNWHLDKAPAFTQICGFAPDNRSAGRMQLDRDRTFHPNELATLLDDLVTVVVDRGIRKRKIPKLSFQAYVYERHLPGGACAWLSNPLNAKMHCVATVCNSDHRVEVELRTDASDSRAVVAHIEGIHGLRKNPPLLVRAKDAHWDLNRFSGLTSHAHTDTLSGCVCYWEVHRLSQKISNRRNPW